MSSSSTNRPALAQLLRRANFWADDNLSRWVKIILDRCTHPQAGKSAHFAVAKMRDLQQGSDVYEVTREGSIYGVFESEDRDAADPFLNPDRRFVL